MKRFISITMAIVLAVSVVIPVSSSAYNFTANSLGDVNGDGVVGIDDALLVLHYSTGKINKFPAEDLLDSSTADPSTYMIFDAETDDGCGTHPVEFGSLWGPVGEAPEFGHPVPVEGNRSYCLNTTTAQTALYHNMGWNTGVTTTGVFDASKYDYIELDIYSSTDIVFDWEFGLCASEEDPAGAAWGMRRVWLPAKRWTHIKMAISEFADFLPDYPGSIGEIHRIRMQLTNITDTFKLLKDGSNESPSSTCIYFDNVIATKEGADRASELINFDEYYLNYYK